jgi:hypothetical protein
VSRQPCPGTVGWLLLALLVAQAPLQAPAAESTGGRCEHHTRLRQPFFGDLHVHTAYSLDAATKGTPRDAYAYARGEPLANPLGRMSKLERPLHFAAVTDHAEWLGEMRLCSDPERSGYDSDICWGYREARDSGLALLAAKARAHEPRALRVLRRGRTALCRRKQRGLARYRLRRGGGLRPQPGLLLHGFRGVGVDRHAGARKQPASQRDLRKRTGPSSAHRVRRGALGGVALEGTPDRV